MLMIGSGSVPEDREYLFVPPLKLSNLDDNISMLSQKRDVVTFGDAQQDFTEFKEGCMGHNDAGLRFNMHCRTCAWGGWTFRY